MTAPPPMAVLVYLEGPTAPGCARRAGHLNPAAVSRIERAGNMTTRVHFMDSGAPWVVWGALEEIERAINGGAEWQASVQMERARRLRD